MPAGKLRNRLVLEKRVQEHDDTHGIDTSYLQVGACWAEIEAVKGGIYMATLQVGEGPTHRIVIRYRPVDFDFVSEGTRRWSVIDSRDPDGRKQWLSLMCEEQTT